MSSHSGVWSVKSFFCCCLIAITSLVNADEKLAVLEQAEESAFKQAAAIVSPTLVRIDTVGGLDVVGELLTSTAPTTGLILTADGYVVSSAFNFIAKPTSILVTLADGNRLPAKLVATDRLRMISLLKIDADKLPVPKVAPKSSLRVGQWSIALGRTYDSAQPSISIGIISALDRIWGKAIQTDAKVSPINYGGPLIDLDGRVMGLLSPLSPDDQSDAAGIEWYDSGIGFAIPLADIYAVLERLKLGKDLRPGLAGVLFKSRDLFGQSVVIDRIRYDSPASKAGLKVGDMIIQADGKPVTRLAQLREVLGTKLEGDAMDVVVKRDNQDVRSQLKLVGELIPYESAFLGILPDRVVAAGEKGIRVRHVYADSAAAKAGLRPQDRITKFKGQDVAGSAQLGDLISRIRPDEEADIEFSRAGKSESQKLKLSAVPNAIPSELASVATPARTDKPAADAPKTGRFTGKVPGYEQEHWAYVPEDYNPAVPYALLVWLHPIRDTMEATIYQEWKSHCDRRGIILVGPRAAQAATWGANEADYVRDVARDFMKTYSIDSRRVVLHGFGTGGVFAAQVGFKYRDVFRGLVLASAPLRSPPPDNEPDLRLQIHLVVGDRDQTVKPMKFSESALRAMKYPVTLQVVKELGAKYPTGESLDPIAIWLDSLDRI